MILVQLFTCFIPKHDLIHMSLVLKANRITYCRRKGSFYPFGQGTYFCESCGCFV